MLANAPLPAPAEHVAGYVRRLAIANALPSLRMLGTMHDVGPMSPLGADDAWRALGRATGLGPEMLEGMRWTSRGRNSHRWLNVSDVAYRLTDLDLKHLRHCPACLAADGILRQAWSVRYVTACPTHRTSLVDTCMGCSRTLLLDERASLFACAACDQPFDEGRPPPADDGAITISAACGGTYGEGHPDPAYKVLLALAPGHAAAVVHHLGRLAELRDAPELPVVQDASRDAPTLAEASRLGAGALSLLLDWPDAYLAFLSLLPREQNAGAADQDSETLTLMANRPPLDENGKPIAFIHDPLLAFRKEALGIEPRRRAPGCHRPPLASGPTMITVEGSPASQPISHAAAMGILEGRNDDRLARWWIDAGLLSEHQGGRGAVLSLDEVTELRLRLDAERGTLGAHHVRLDHVDLNFTKGRAYRKDSFLKDVFAGRIASVRIDDGSALGGLAFDRHDLERLRGEARLAAWQAADAHVAFTKLIEAASPVFGPGSMPSMADCNAAARRGELRFTYYLPPTTDARRQKRWAVRDLVDAIERSGHARITPEKKKRSG